MRRLSAAYPHQQKPKRIAESPHWSICWSAGLIRDSPKKASKKEKPASKNFKEEEKSLSALHTKKEEYAVGT